MTPCRSGTRWRWVWPAALLLGTAILYLFNLGRVGLFDPAEGLYAEIGREMTVLHDWVTPHLNYIRYFEKPPLSYWLDATLFSILGVSEFAARLPSALAAIATVAVVCLMGRDLWGRRVGLAAGVVMATCFGTFIFGRLMLPDMLLVSLLTAAFWGLARGLLGAAPQPRAVLAAYVAMAGAVMAKGLIGVVFPLLTIGVFLGVTRDWRRVARLELLRGPVIFLALTVPWHVLVAVRNPGFLWFYFVNEHVLRFLGTRQADYSPVPVLTYLALTAVWFCPWAVFLPAALRRSFRRDADGRMDRRSLFVLCWAGVVIGFFALSSARLEFYALPALPALALIVGRLWAREREPMGAPRLWPSWAGLVIFGLALVPLAALFPRLEHSKFYNLFPHLSPPSAAGADLAAAKIWLVPTFADLVPAFQRVIAVLLVGILLSAAIWWRGWRGWALACLSLTVGVAFWGLEDAFVRFAPFRSVAQLGAVIRSEWRPGDEIVVDGRYDFHAGIDFYTGRRAIVYRGEGGDLEFGQRYPEAAGTRVNGAQFDRLWQGRARVFLLTDDPELLPRLRTLTAETALLGRTGGTWLLVNRPATDELRGSTHPPQG